MIGRRLTPNDHAKLMHERTFKGDPAVQVWPAVDTPAFLVSATLDAVIRLDECDGASHEHVRETVRARLHRFVDTLFEVRREG